MLNKWSKILLVIITIFTMITWAVNYKINREDIETNGYIIYSLAENLKEINYQLSTDILRATLYGQYNNDYIDKIVDSLEFATSKFNNSIVYKSGNYPKTKVVFDEFIVNEKKTLSRIELFKRKNGQIKNSTNFLTSSLQKFDHIKVEKQQKLLNLMSSIFTLENNMNTYKEGNIDLDVSFLDASEVLHNEDKEYIKLFKIHIGLLEKNLPNYIKLVNSLINNKSNVEQFEELIKVIKLENEQNIKKLDYEYYLLILFSFLTLLIIIYYIINSENERQHILKLQKDYKDSVTKDPLTNLKNRNMYLEEIKNIKNPVAILFDILEFRSINNLYGLKVGDFVLKNIAKLVLEKIEHLDKTELYKVGFDQYLIISNSIDEKDASILANNIIKELDLNPFVDNELKQPIHLQVQAGISSKNPYIINSAIALKSIKDDFNKKVGVFNDSMDETKDIKKNISMIQKVKHAIQADNIVMLFQPLIDLRTRKTIKYESLVRLKDDDEFISPYFFLDLSKKAKLYTEITHKVIEKSILMLIEKGIDISINISIEDILHKETHDFILKKLEQNPDIAKKITFELLESEEIHDFNALKEFIDRVKYLGVQIAIDDFGSGYSNYNYLIELDVDILKIDGSLIKNIDKSKNNQLVVKSIVEFAKLANIKTVAEFVENEDIDRVVKELGIDYGQGYYYSPPRLI